MKALTFLITLSITLASVSYGASARDHSTSASGISPNSHIQKALAQNSHEFVNAPDWARNAVIYEVNIRQFTKEGTFEAFAEHLPRLKKLGVNVLWIMPIHPIGSRNRKGELGSYYAVENYKGINREFGNTESFKNLVSQAHALGMRVMLDWVANHTSPDHHWQEEHPNWYQRNSDGTLNYLMDWVNTANLNYANNNMREAMIDAMLYWVKEFDIDGFRCDFAVSVPADFWQLAISRLQQEKPLLFLAEDGRSQALLEAGFHLNYGMGLFYVMQELAAKRFAARKLPGFVDQWLRFYSEDTSPLLYLSNHDENSWRGAVDWRFGSLSDPLLVLTFTLPGIPLIYSGQEAGLEKSLKFFDKDEIPWRDHPRSELIRRLGQLKNTNQALMEFPSEAGLIWLDKGHQGVLVYERRAIKDAVQVFINMSDERVVLEKATALLLPHSVVQSPGVVMEMQKPIELPAFGYAVRSSKL